MGVWDGGDSSFVGLSGFRDGMDGGVVFSSSEDKSCSGISGCGVLETASCQGDCV